MWGRTESIGHARRNNNNNIATQRAGRLNVWDEFIWACCSPMSWRCSEDGWRLKDMLTLGNDLFFGGGTHVHRSEASQLIH